MTSQNMTSHDVTQHVTPHDDMTSHDMSHMTS